MLFELTFSLLLRLKFNDSIEVIVGEQRESFTVHKEILTKRSPFIEAACSQRWNTPGPFRPIELPDDDIRAFDMYLNCMYTNRVNTDDAYDAGPGEEEWCEDQRMRRLMLRTYILADKLGDIVTANLLLDGILDVYNSDQSAPSVDTIDFVFSSTAPDTPLQRLFIDIYVYADSGTLISDLLQSGHVPRAFLHPYMEKTASLLRAHPGRRFRDVFMRDIIDDYRCRYYPHDETDALGPCCGNGCQRCENCRSSGRRR